MAVRSVVLLSGGIDSSACLGMFVLRGWEAEGLFINYGHPAADAEYKAAQKISNHYGVALSIVSVRGIPRVDAGYVPGRNAMLLDFALSRLASSRGIIGLGIHAGTGYVDCSPAFISAYQGLVDIYAGGKIKIDVPFLDWSKKQIVEYCKSIQVPLEYTYSCERGGETPCQNCATCKDLIALRVTHDCFT